jgi:Galactose oxidase, central domain
VKASLKTSNGLFKLSFVLLLVLLGLASHVSKVIAQSPGTFTNTGDMISSRSQHSATLLADGRVLIVGGMGGSSTELSSAELYDPDRGTFIRTGNMTTPRRGHTATLLADGKVLVAGGFGGSVLVAGGYRPSGSLASAEIYDPATGTFTATGSMANAQSGHTATLLHNGKVLIAGGLIATPSILPDHAELYDPASGTFSAGPFSHSLVWPTATLMPDGNVLTAVGRFVETIGFVQGRYGIIRLSFDSSQLFDPVANTFIATGEIPLYTTYWHTATLLKNGMVLLAGGGDGDTGFYSPSAGLFDPATRDFNETSRMTTVRAGHTASLLNDGTVLITGGADDASSELYDPSTGTFTSTASMSERRIYHTATLLNDGSVLVVGGSSKYNSRSAEIYRPLLLIPTPIVSDFRFDQTDVAAGTSYSVSVSGSNLTPETFFDVRLSTPGSDTYAVVLNWQRGLTVSHSVPAGTTAGSWTINGVRAHQEEEDHTGDFAPFNATITVTK